MKSHFAFWVAFGLLASTSASADGISISVPNDANTSCTVTGTSLVSDGSGGFILQNGVSNSCGAPGSGPPNPSTSNVSLTVSPVSLTLSPTSQPSATVTWTADVTGATGCTVIGATTATTSNFTISQGSITNNATTTVGSATVQPLATAVAGAYSFTISGCTFPNNANNDPVTTGIVRNAALSLTNGGGNCSSTQLSDTSYVLSRLCTASVTNPYLQTSSVTTLDQYGNIWGAWPVSDATSGSARVIVLAPNQFVALAFQPSPNAMIKITASPTYGGGTLSVSTTPGGFTRGDTAYGVVCAAANAGSTNMTISSNGTSASCVLDPNQTYYLNISSIRSTGLKGCLTATCSAAFYVTKVGN